MVSATETTSPKRTMSHADTPCRWCGDLFTGRGVKRHENKCKSNPENTEGDSQAVAGTACPPASLGESPSPSNGGEVPPPAPEDPPSIEPEGAGNHTESQEPEAVPSPAEGAGVDSPGGSTPTEPPSLHGGGGVPQTHAPPPPVALRELVVHPSSADLARQCAQSLRPAIRIRTDGPGARTGTVYHRVMAQVVRERLESAPPIEPHVHDDDHGVSAKDVFYLVRDSLSAWLKLEPWFSPETTEVELRRRYTLEIPEGTITIDQTADVRCQRGRTALVLDWKSARHYRKHPEQLRWYAWGALQDMPTADRALVYVVHARHGVVDAPPKPLERATLEKWARKRARHYLTSTDYHVGSNCTWCPRRYDCPARVAMIRPWVERVAELTVDGPGGLDPVRLPDEDVDALFRVVRMVEGCAKDAKQVLRDLVAERGEVAAGPGKVWKLQSSDRTVIDPVKALPMLNRHFGEEDFAAFLKVDKTALGRRISAKAEASTDGRRERAAYKRGLWQELEEIDAVRVVPGGKRLVETKKAEGKA